ncbi:hypothetical protein O181_090682 [Austropuccinia psidii MF-1]|uniref:Protein CPL1-like domain-containing protein n=1 Tax=Austropuccinia psidii MF-1 TaxID=1389203 RepID=A0A9Q3IW09_9BASI|nr:hypothetical protein [Austropuccinia psidii MF-1]
MASICLTTITPKSLHSTRGPKAALSIQPREQDSASGYPKLEEIPKATVTRENKTLASRSILGILEGATRVQVEICLDLSVTILGNKILNAVAVANLDLAIQRNGITLQQLAIIQANLASKLQATAQAATTSWACESSCYSNFCRNYSFNSASRVCTLTPKQLTTTSSLLANIISELSLDGSASSDYCSLCPGRCATSPTALSRLRKRSQITLGFCPTGLDACPISSLKPSAGYECINTKEELESCGGCATTGDGMNCNTLLGVKSAGCSAGQCLAFDCEAGFQLTDQNTCVLRSF